MSEAATAIVEILNLYLPLMLSLALGITAAGLRDDKSKSDVREITLSLYFFEMPVWKIKDVTLRRLALLGMAALLLFFAVCRDYSTIYPRQLTMEVFYDEEGLRRTLAELPQDDVQALHVRWSDERRQQYYHSLDRELTDAVDELPFFSAGDGAVHSHGRTTFVVRKLGWFLQRYRIESSHGELSHTLDRPGRAQVQVVTYFEKLETKHDYLQLTIRDAVARRRIILRPRFKQSLANERTGVRRVFRTSVVGLTLVKIFPTPTFTGTIYLAEVADGELTPVGYAVYRVED